MLSITVRLLALDRWAEFVAFKDDTVSDLKTLALLHWGLVPDNACAIHQLRSSRTMTAQRASIQSHAQDKHTAAYDSVLRDYAFLHLCGYFLEDSDRLGDVLLDHDVITLQKRSSPVIISLERFHLPYLQIECIVQSSSSTGPQVLSSQDTRWRDVTLRVENNTLSISKSSKPSSTYTLALPPVDSRITEYSTGRAEEYGESTTTLILNFSGDLKLAVRPRDAGYWSDLLAQFGPNGYFMDQITRLKVKAKRERAVQRACQANLFAAYRISSDLSDDQARSETASLLSSHSKISDAESVKQQLRRARSFLSPAHESDYTSLRSAAKPVDSRSAVRPQTASECLKTRSMLAKPPDQAIQKNPSTPRLQKFTARDDFERPTRPVRRCYDVEIEAN